MNSIELGKDGIASSIITVSKNFAEFVSKPTVLTPTVLILSRSYVFAEPFKPPLQRPEGAKSWTRS